MYLSPFLPYPLFSPYPSHKNTTIAWQPSDATSDSPRAIQNNNTGPDSFETHGIIEYTVGAGVKLFDPMIGAGRYDDIDAWTSDNVAGFAGPGFYDDTVTPASVKWIAMKNDPPRPNALIVEKRHE